MAVKSKTKTDWPGMLAKMGNCVSCGKCLPDCPVYVLTNREENSPRGKIAVLRWFLASGGHPGPASAMVFFQCPLCLRCQDNCPSKLEMAEIFMAARRNLEQQGLAPVPAILPMAETVRRTRLLPVGRASRGKAVADGEGWPVFPHSSGLYRNCLEKVYPQTGKAAAKQARLLVSPLLAAAAPALVNLHAAALQADGWQVVVRLLAGPSWFRLYWAGRFDELRKRLAEEKRLLPKGGRPIFVEPELAAIWHSGADPARLIPVEVPAEGIRPNAGLGPSPWDVRADVLFTVLPPPLPFGKDGIKAWNARWDRERLSGWRPFPDEWRLYRGEGLVPFYPAMARRLAEQLLVAARGAGLQAIGCPSPRSLLWLHSSFSEGGPRAVFWPA